jgi:hypothetical protein
MTDELEDPGPKDDTSKASRRKFIREVGSVVLGVLIALTLGEVADAARWQLRAAQSNAAINAELARVAGVLDERVMVQPCLTKRLTELDRLLREARISHALPNIAEIGRPPYRPTQAGAWDDAVSSGTLLHLTAERRATLSLNYPTIQSYDRELKEEQNIWATLRILEATPGPISDDLLAEASVSVARLRYSSEMNELSAKETRDDIFRTGVAASYFIILDREGSRAEVAAAIEARPVCRALIAEKPL